MRIYQVKSWVAEENNYNKMSEIATKHFSSMKKANNCVDEMISSEKFMQKDDCTVTDVSRNYHRFVKIRYGQFGEYYKRITISPINVD